MQGPQGISCRQMQTFYKFTFLNASLGNRNPILGRAQTKLRPLCAVYFIYKNLHEVHLLIDCKNMEYIRTSSGLSKFLDTTTTTSKDKYRDLWLNNYSELAAITAATRAMKVEFYREISYKVY